MNVGTICQRLVINVRRSDEVVSAAQLMRSKHVGYLVVVEPTNEGTVRPVGVLTDRDIVVEVVAGEVDPRTLRVDDIMTADPVTVGENDSVEEALREMRQSGVRRVPVVNQRGELVGIVAADDALNVVAGDALDIVNVVRNERQIEGRRRR
jgi:predicted transcriptional regulator